MEGSTYVLLSGCLTYGIPLGLAVRELVLLRRDRGSRREPGEEVRPVPMPLAPSPPGLSPELPACLIPTLRPVRARELETV